MAVDRELRTVAVPTHDVLDHSTLGIAINSEQQEQEQQHGPSVAIVVVVYNRRVDSLPSLAVARAAKASERLRWLIVDNSPIAEEGAKETAEASGVDYLWMGGNQGISAAFNRGIDRVASTVDYVCFLDQDTDEIEAYIQNATQILRAEKPDVLMPLVVSDELVLSPCRRVGPWYRPLATIGDLPRNFSCINSGMIVKRSVLSEVRFDETLFLDYVDHKFVLDAVRHGVEFLPAWNCRLIQDYSRNSDSPEQALVRFEIFKRDVRKFYVSNSFGTLWSTLLIGWRGLRAALQYRSCAFLVPSRFRSVRNA